MLQALGDASYSIYLSHLFVLGAWRAIWSLLAPGHLGVPQALALSVCALALCAGAGGACYRWVEAPMTRFLQRFL